MKQNKIIRGILPPLFDRIIQDGSGTGMTLKLLNAQELKESIIHELELVLNTRCTVRKIIYEDHLESIPLFGMPDFFGMGDMSYFDGSNSQEWPKIARFIETAITAAEPRLQNVHVKVTNYDGTDQMLEIDVSASLKESDLLKEIHFPLTLSHRSSSSKKAAA